MKIPYTGRVLATIMTTAILAAVSALGQPTTPGDKGAVFRADTRSVVLHATVVDKNGRFVTNLPLEAFTVLDNGVRQEIKTFRSEDVPVACAVCAPHYAYCDFSTVKVNTAHEY
jgi:hypothetical protein